MATTPTATPKQDPDELDHERDDELDRDLDGIHIKDNWKAEGMFALFDGDRLITRSATRRSLVDAMDRIKRTRSTPFSTRVAPVEVTENADDDAPPRKSKSASWAE